MDRDFFFFFYIKGNMYVIYSEVVDMKLVRKSRYVHVFLPGAVETSGAWWAVYSPWGRRVE